MNRLRELRTASGMTQKDLADKLRCVPTAISKYELEQLGMDSKIISKLCDIFGCTADYLIGRSSVPYDAVSPEDAQLLQTYHALPLEIRRAVDGLMEPYRAEAEEKKVV